METSTDDIRRQWSEAWPKAIEAWSRYTRLHAPRLCESHREAVAEGLTGSFAMIRLADQSVVIDMAEVVSKKIHPYAVEVLAHEIGHHVLAPANLGDHARCIARIRKALPTLEGQAPMVANLYTDLLINDRLQRAAGLRMDAVYRLLKLENPGKLWQLYLRIYELLWSLERGSLGAPFQDDRIEGDALLGMRVVRGYAIDWLDGAGRFASLLLPYLIDDREAIEACLSFGDTLNAGAGGLPDGLAETDPQEDSGAIHPATDPSLSGLEDADESTRGGGIPAPDEAERHEPAKGQQRTPFVYGEILRAAGARLNDDEIAARFYRERALPWLVPFPTRQGRESADPIPEGLEPWDIGHPLDDADWLESVFQSPVVIPGLTTVRRTWGTAEGKNPERVPLDLDIYVDSSGSMPHPYHQISWLTLAGAVMALSALRAGARVHAVLWSGKRQVLATDGFVRDELAILRVLAGYFGGVTQFPIPTLRETWRHRREDAAPAHVMVISDDGVSTMFDPDERGTSGFDVAAMVLRKARGGGSLVLNLPGNWEAYPIYPAYATILRARLEQGWNVHRVASWENLLDFAREFSRRHYGEAAQPAIRP